MLMHWVWWAEFAFNLQIWLCHWRYHTWGRRFWFSIILNLLKNEAQTFGVFNGQLYIFNTTLITNFIFFEFLAFGSEGSLIVLTARYILCLSVVKLPNLESSQIPLVIPQDQWPRITTTLVPALTSKFKAA